MARLGKINSNLNKKKMIDRSRTKRAELRVKSKNAHLTQEEREDARNLLSKMPRNSSETRWRNRCELTGRPRAFMRKFKLCRIKFRELALAGLIPGVTKSSW